MQPFFGVDIGNSGLRVAELKIASRELGTMLRIDWRRAPSDAAKRERSLPSDPAWLGGLREFLMEHENASKASHSAPQPPQPPQPPIHWLISSVRDDALQLLVDYLSSKTTSRVQVIDYRELPLAIHMPLPDRVGIDRLLAAYAACELTETRPFVVVQAGSAVTVDLVDACSPEDAVSTLAAFKGGAILPGVPMMLRIMGQAADRLPQIDADDLLGLPDLPGKNTEQAMMCGAASALVGGVSHLVGRYRNQYGRDLPVILSGGDGMRLSPYLDGPLVMESHLVHRGLLRLALSAAEQIS